MAQQDYVIADQTGVSFLADVNLNLAAIVSNNSGATEPATKYAYQWWADTTSGILKQRNAANSAWIAKSFLSAAFDTNLEAGATKTSRKNLLINGNFDINHEGVSGTVTLAAGAYGHDMFLGGASGCTYTFAIAENVTTLTITAGSLIQVVEGVSLFTGTYVLSFDGTAQGKIGGGSFSSSGVTGSITGGVNTNIEFNSGTLSKVQLENSLVKTDFEIERQGSILLACQWYYEIGRVELNAATFAGNPFGVSTEFSSLKRIPPVITLNVINNVNVSSVSATNIVQSGFTLSGSATSGSPSACQINYDYKADARLYP